MILQIIFCIQTDKHLSKYSILYLPPAPSLTPPVAGSDWVLICGGVAAVAPWWLGAGGSGGLITSRQANNFLIRRLIYIHAIKSNFM